MVDPANRDEGAIGDGGDLRDKTRADRRPAGLGRREIHRSHRNIVSTLLNGGSRLLEAVGRPSDQPAVEAWKLAHNGRR